MVTGCPDTLERKEPWLRVLRRQQTWQQGVLILLPMTILCFVFVHTRVASSLDLSGQENGRVQRKSLFLHATLLLD